MSALRIVSFIAVLFSFQFSFAYHQVGSISCAVVGAEDTQSVNAEIFGYGTPEDGVIKYANIQWTSKDPVTKTETVLKKWDKVEYGYDDSALSFSLLFKNSEVELDAVFDDVGAISSLRFDGKFQPLTCGISLFE